VPSLDTTVEGWFEPLRGRPAADAAAKVVSNLSDYGLAWSVVAAVKGRRPGPGRRRAARALAMAGVSSFTLNALIKRAVGRTRPEGAHEPAGVRAPTSSSFPSGHTLAAFCTAVTMADSGAELAAYLGFAAAVGASRVQLRAHHPTDVVGGAVIGAGLGLALRRVGECRRPGRR
jgi:undecaprenyl-diphosphatase